MPRGAQYNNQLSDKPANVRARLRRKDRKIKMTEEQMMDEVQLLPRYKRVSDWDYEELARGRPRCADGSFKGPMPAWITPLVRREAERRLVDLAKSELATHVSSAVAVIHNLMMDEEVDDDGKPIVSPSVKLDAAKFVIEQIVGKSKQRVDLEAGESVAEFLSQFKGGLVKRTGEAYKPRRGQIVIDEDGVEVGE